MPAIFTTPAALAELIELQLATGDKQNATELAESVLGDPQTDTAAASRIRAALERYNINIDTTIYRSFICSIY